MIDNNSKYSTDYPAAFAGELQNGDVRLGYKDRRTGFPNHISGWYAEGERIEYDWQQFDPLTDPPPVGLVLESRDVFDNKSTIEYDYYQMLPLSTKQWLNGTDYLETIAEYDYRVMQAFKVTDPNDNITEFDFSPLGLLTATAVIGKGTEGDYKAATGTFYERFAPSVKMEYDFFAFKNEGDPVWVKTIQREQHWQDDPDPDSPTIVSKEYSDGFGRLLQTRAQAEDVIFGNQTFGSSGLPADQNAQNGPAVGVERDEQDPLNVVVSGWKIYNNKGEVVEQYEPFFDKGFDYTLPHLSTTGGTIPPQLGVKIKMYYDPLGRVVKTVNPDNSEQRVIFGTPDALSTPDDFTPTPWENYAYDANDLAPLTNPTGSNVPASHYYTPKSSLIDALGRTISTTEHKASYNDDTSQYEDVVMRYFYDIRGNLLEVRDPYNRKVFEHVYDLRPPQKDENGEQQPLPPLWTRHIDQGEGRVLFDATGKPIESSDAKNARSLNTYDGFNRPINGWSQNNSSDTLRLTAHAIYGETATNPKDDNLQGQLWQEYNESGKTEMVTFDFKGNLLSKKQMVISSSELKSALDNYDTYLVNWTGLPSILGTQVFETSTAFDALNRPVKITLPENVNTDRKEIIPTYNRAGALEKVEYDSTEYVKNIVYNAKGQRLLIAFGNDVMTRYVYSNTTFRLQRYRSEKYTYSQAGDTHTYTKQAGTNRYDDGFNFDLVGNIIKILNRVTDCGISGTSLGSNALDRSFEYDPMYRVTSANGRESDTQDQNEYLYNDAPIPGSPNADNVRAYERQYSYDKLGNIQQLKQLGTNGFTRDFSYFSGKNTLEKIENATPSVIESFTYDNVGNQLTAGTTRNYVWNAANQLITYYNQVGGSDPTIFAQYDYDGGGNRVSKLVRTGSASSPVYERTIYIDGVFEYHILENGTTYEKNYVHVMDGTSRIAMVRIGDQFPDDISDNITYNLEDQIGSSSMRLNTSGSVIDKEEYYPFGDSSLRTFSKKRYRYVGKEKDLESGLYYYGARYYAAWTCRFISVDPMAADYSFYTPYNYAGNKPIIAIDLNGLQEFLIVSFKNSSNLKGWAVKRLGIPSASTDTLDKMQKELETLKLRKQGEIDLKHSRSRKEFKKVIAQVDSYINEVEALIVEEKARIKSENARLIEENKGKAVYITVENANVSNANDVIRQMQTISSSQYSGKPIQDLDPGTKKLLENSSNNAKVSSFNISGSSGDIYAQYVPLSFSGDALFDTDSYTLRPQGEKDLMPIVQTLIANPEMTIDIIGHTDNTGNESDNLTLSSNRANAVSEFLINQGVDPSQIRNISGVGSSNPVGDNNTSIGRQQNRRVEINQVKK